MASILCVDDQPEVLQLLSKVLSRDYEVDTAPDGETALARVESRPPDCILLDIDMPGMNGLEVLDRVRGDYPSVPVVMLSGVKEVETAISALKRGAYDFLTKPPDFEELTHAVERAIEKTALLTEVRRLRGEITRAYGIPNIIGKHPKMLEIFELVGQVASRKAPVHIYGESGTGKELIARAIHQHGPRAGGPFVAVNCAAVPDTLFEAEFFGHERGAFTDAKSARAGYFERADGGTLFLDEVGELDPSNQAKLLRVLQEREVTRLGATRTVPFDARVISATNRRLWPLVEEGGFRQDLYYRLDVIPVDVPSLRERRSDIPLLVGHFISRIAKQEGEPPKTVSPEAMRKLQAYRWPGNVRELENMLERLMAMTAGEEIEHVRMPGQVDAEAGGGADLLFEQVLSGETSLVGAVEGFERRVIEEALERSDGNKSAAAGLIGISRRMLRYKLERSSDE
jgi:DNA-binding NtrC family response regulator